jgi:integrase
MARLIERLTETDLTRAKPGYHADGGGLYLRVLDDGARNWLFRFQINGKERWAGLGGVHTVNLIEARDQALECRKLLRAGIDPIEDRRAKKRKASLEGAKETTFKECAESYIKAHRAGWRSIKHVAQWEATLATYAFPHIGSLSVQAIDTALVMKVLEQPMAGATLWTARPETASRLRGRMESILDWAKARGYREGENPARWRGHLDHLLPARTKVQKVKHHAALPYDEIPAFIAALREQEGVSALALKFAILTAARTGEVIGARLHEISQRDKVWTVPAERMKAGKEHRVPLAARALDIVNRIDGQSDGFVFPGSKAGLSNMALLMTLRRMGRTDLTAHGFRATFKTWASERTNFPREVIEAALAHTIGNKVEAAYQRGDLFDKRRRLMQQWATFCTAAPVRERQNNVTPLRKRS